MTTTRQVDGTSPIFGHLKGSGFTRVTAGVLVGTAADPEAHLWIHELDVHDDGSRSITGLRVMLGPTPDVICVTEPGTKRPMIAFPTFIMPTTLSTYSGSSDLAAYLVVDPSRMDDTSMREPCGSTTLVGTIVFIPVGVDASEVPTAIKKELLKSHTSV